MKIIPGRAGSRSQGSPGRPDFLIITPGQSGTIRHFLPGRPKFFYDISGQADAVRGEACPGSPGKWAAEGAGVLR